MSDSTRSVHQDGSSEQGTNKEQEFLRTIVACVADGVLVVDDGGRVRFANPAAGALFDREVEQLIGTEFGFPIVAGETTEIDIVRPGGSLITAELRVANMSWRGEHESLVSLRDITQRREAEETARQLALEQAARVQAEELSQAKSDFLAVMSHELRTPLNAVLGYIELLDLGVTGPLTEAQRGQLHRVTLSARHLLRLVNEILDFSTLEAGQLTVECLPHRAASVADMACNVVQSLAARRKVELARRYDSDEGRRYIGDETRTRQILLNLLSNALKFTDPPGKVWVEIVEVDAPPLTLPPSPSGRWVGFRVSDTGIGIPEDQRETAFSPFTQLDTGHTRRRDGTGLGLPISRRLALLMGGDVTVESSPGRGSTFTLWLPASA
ncbi:MAG: ATP-binding protein [Gemmatimonadota bacterium]|nr:ATP-binding protein [Gemmatimonadota bacterium]